MSIWVILLRPLPFPTQSHRTRLQCPPFLHETLSISLPLSLFRPVVSAWKFVEIIQWLIEMHLHCRQSTHCCYRSIAINISELNMNNMDVVIGFRCLRLTMNSLLSRARLICQYIFLFLYIIELTFCRLLLPIVRESVTAYIPWTASVTEKVQSTSPSRLHENE